MSYFEIVKWTNSFFQVTGKICEKIEEENKIQLNRSLYNDGAPLVEFKTATAHFAAPKCKKVNCHKAEID